MKYIQTFFCLESQDLMVDSFGWINPQFHLMSWALSCLSIKKTFGRVELYTNKRNKDFFIDKLGLPYDEVHEISSQFTLPHPQLWALPKIYTYSIQDSPFIHIDGDVYLFSKFPCNIEQANIIAQNEELFTNYYYDLMPSIMNNLKYIPKYVLYDFKKRKKLRALNAGILGGQNISFFKEYTKEAFQYVNLNLRELPKINVNNFNVFVEQHLCYKMAESYNQKIEYLLKPMYCDNGYMDLAEFHKIPLNTCDYIHLMGNYKRDLFTCQQMEKTLLCLFPDFHKRIVELFQNCSVPFTKQESLYYNNCNAEKQRDRILKALEEKIIKNASLEKDFTEWNYNFYKNIQYYSNVENTILQERDKNSFLWYKHIFTQKESKLIRAPFTEVIQSKYDWARLYRGQIPTGNDYYEISQEDLREGNFYSLFIKEVNPYSFSIYDIDELEYLILKELNEAMNIEDLFRKMLSYVEDDVLLNNFESYHLLIMQNIERLILFKAIMPQTK